MTKTFADLGLAPPLVTAVTGAGYQHPTPIQARAIPALLHGRDVLGQAQTGSGKTAAYGLPLLQAVEARGPIQALVLVPTRELAQQVTEQLQAWNASIAILAVYGGQPIVGQLRRLRQGVQVVVATPGRLVDHLERGSMTLDDIRFCVLDEADEMLDFGFEEELEAILSRVPSASRMALFSATFPPRIKQLSERYLKHAERIEIEAQQRTVETVNQYYVLVRPGKKAASLGRLLDHQEHGLALVFCRTRLDTQQLTDELRARGYGAEALHGDMDQNERERVMDRFRAGQCRILVATDIAARGLDVSGVSHVFNFDIPWDAEQYIHRVGRTARAGRSGTAITLIESNQQRHLQRLERESGAKFQRLEIPSLASIEESRRQRFAEQIRLQLEDPACMQQLPLARSLAQKADPLAVAAAALQALWERSFTALDQEEEDLAPLAASPKVRPYVWVSFSVGRREDITPGDLLRAITNETGLTKAILGKIVIEEKRTFVEVLTVKAEKLLAEMKRARIKGKRVKVEAAPGPRQEGPPFGGGGKRERHKR